jgi:hypothetical protein
MCANLYIHAKEKGCTPREAEALALQETWKARLGVVYPPAAERRARIVFTRREAS